MLNLGSKRNVLGSDEISIRTNRSPLWGCSERRFYEDETKEVMACMFLVPL